jgi:TatD DNase family protein
MSGVLEFVDTHCHIQFPDYSMDPEEAIANAADDGVTRLLAVGCTVPDSRAAVDMAARHDNVWASIGLHPHEGARYVEDHESLHAFRNLAGAKKVVAIGETGLDYYYEHSPKADQEKLLRYQLDLAAEHDLPLIFHVRDAFDDFWRILNEHPKVRGVVHSFSAGMNELESILERGLHVGLNGIMTFTKRSDQLAAAKAVPIEKLLLETDAPFLTPAPFRGKIGEPKYVRVTAEFLSDLREESLETLAAATTRNARELFNLS